MTVMYCYMTKVYGGYWGIQKYKATNITNITYKTVGHHLVDLQILMS